MTTDYYSPTWGSSITRTVATCHKERNRHDRRSEDP